MRLSRASFHRTAVLPVAAAALTIAGCQSGPPGPGDVSGSYIVTISDADTLAPAFVTGTLGERDPNVGDLMTVLKLPIREPTTDYALLNVSNSVIGPPRSLAVSRDGRYAYVVETRGQAPPGAFTLDDLPPGETLTAVDLTDPMRPAVIATAYTGAEPMAVDVHPDGDLLVLATRNPGAQLVVMPVRGGAPVEAEAVTWPLLGIDDSGAAATSVAWSPDGRSLAVTLPDRDQVMFYGFRRDAGDENGMAGGGEGGGGGGFSLSPWGGPVAVGRYPYSGAFTPDGRHFITTDLGWGGDVEGFMVGAPAGRLSVVRLSDTPPSDADGGDASFDALHEVVSTAPVGVSPEGLAISRDGSLVVTSNLRLSYLPESDDRLTRGGSISLLTFDEGSGSLTPINEYEIDGMPEGLAFDADDKFVIITQFRSFDPSAVDGELAFFKVRRGDPPSLELTDFRVGVGKGPHGVLIVR